MSIMLGDLSVEQIEKRTGVKFPSVLKKYMEVRYQPSATNIQPGKWHCFDMPFMLLCGDMETAQTIYDHLKDMSASFSVSMQIGVQQ